MKWIKVKRGIFPSRKNKIEFVLRNGIVMGNQCNAAPFFLVIWRKKWYNYFIQF